MMIRTFLFIAFLFIAPLPAAAQTFNAESFTLENGMQVVVIPNHRAPVVTHMVWYKVGAADELPGQSGLAHYLEHLLFKGTEKIAPGEYAKIIKTMGGNSNAFTSQDYTAYYESVSVDHLEKVMEMEADRMFNANPPAEHYDSEKQVIIEERRQRTENDPKGLFSEQMQSALFVNHPYGTPVIGWMDEMSSYQWEDVKTFYQTWYAPNNAILVVSGDITAEQLKPLAEKTYGLLTKKDIPARVRPNVPPAIGETKMTLYHPVIRQPVFQRVYLAPNYHDNKDDSLALQVLEDILDGSATTRLYKSLVVEQKKASSVNLSYRPDALDHGVFWLSATPAPDVALEELETLIDAELRNIIETGVSERELKEAIQRLQDAAVYARDSLSGPANIFGYALATGSTVQDVENWPQDIAAVTAKQVQAAATDYLNPDNPWIRPPVTGYLLPEEVTEIIEEPKEEPTAEESE